MNGAVHFVGFRDDRYWSAVAVWGLPDFYHRVWDARAREEVMPGDTVVFATGDADRDPTPFNYDDSNQADDPAALERGNK